MKKTLIMILFFLLLLQGYAQERHALVICARSGSQTLLDENRKYTEQTIELLKKAGISDIRCFIEGGEKTLSGTSPVNAENIIAHVKKVSEKLKKEDELWLFIYGYASQSAKRLSIITEGGRLNAADLAELLKKTTARKFIFCMNVQSFPLMELLKDNDAVIVSAASDPGQLNPPLLPAYLLPAWLSGTYKPFNQVLLSAVDALNAHYKEASLAVSETAVIYADGQFYRYPFEKKIQALAPASFVIGGNEKEAPSQPYRKAVPGEKGDKDISTVMPADDETKAIIADARKAAAGYPDAYAVCVKSSLECTITQDADIIYHENSYVYIAADLGIDMYSRLSFMDWPPYSMFKLLNARVIYPDGRYMDVKEDKARSRAGEGFHRLFFKSLSTGSVIIYNVEFKYRKESNIPFFEKGFSVQQGIPVHEYTLTVRTPLKQSCFFKVVNGSAEKKERDEQYSRITEFKFRKLAAYEPLPFDPPADEALIKVLMSFNGSWEEFAKWAGIMFEGSEKVDEKTAALVKELCANASTDAEKLKAIYEFLCNLRYETVPSGARAFRPRTPSEVCSAKYGDCKDKANALVMMAACAGVKGNFALVKRGGRVISDFPSNQFNHAVAYFPSLNGFPDGFWCDPTDTSTPFASLPPGDLGCDAFVMTEKGGEFRKIKLSGKRDNVLAQDIVFNVTSDEKFTGKVIFRADGIMDYYLRMKFKNRTRLQKISIAQEILNQCFRGAYVTGLEHTQGDNLSEAFRLTLEISGDCWPMVRDGMQLPYNFWGPFSMKGRDRAVFINDGQPFKVLQTVKVNGASFKQGSQCEVSAGPLALKCRYEDDMTKRCMEADLKDGMISREDYEKILPVIRLWYSKMIN